MSIHAPEELIAYGELTRALDRLGRIGIEPDGPIAFVLGEKPMARVVCHKKMYDVFYELELLEPE